MRVWGGGMRGTGVGVWGEGMRGMRDMRITGYEGYEDYNSIVIKLLINL